MFRRLSSSLPKDPKVPADLKALGYFVNENDSIRQIEHPDQKYQYQINRNERVNEVHKEAMNACIRTIVIDRLKKLNLDQVRLPLGASPTEQHTSILVSKNLAQKRRITVLFGECNNDLGVLAYRVIGGESINQGSAVDFVTAIDQAPAPNDTRGIIITNPGQLLWYRGEGRAVTYSEWMSLPRKTAVHDALELDPNKCGIPGNRDHREHVQYIFEHVMRELVHDNATFELIGLGVTGYAMISYLAENWNEWSSRIAGICLGSPQHSTRDIITPGSSDQAFADFISKRCRAYLVSDAEQETFLTGREEYGCNCYASGEQYYQENVIIAAWRSMLDWFNLVASSPGYEEVEVFVRQSQEDEQVNGDVEGGVAAGERWP